jgi:hypothetical protein
MSEMEDKSGVVELGAGSGWFIPSRGHVPTRDKNDAMIFADKADADQWMRENGYTVAIDCRQRADDRLKGIRK